MRSLPSLPPPSPKHPLSYLHFPFQFLDGINCVGIVSGVVCLSYSVRTAADSAMLWNPAIRKAVALPTPSQLPPPCPFAVSIGFGYDRRKNDFKVVRIQIPNNQDHISYDMYSPRQGQWREGIIANIDLTLCVFNPIAKRISCFVNGTIHWRLTKLSLETDHELSYLVLIFDCELEEFTTIELPREIHNPSRDGTMEAELTYLELLEHAGFLSVLVRWANRNNNYLELWVMQEHGGWEKLYRIRDNDKIEICIPTFGNRASFGPNQWIEFRPGQIPRGYVYEESMFLMDDAKAQSC